MTNVLECKDLNELIRLSWSYPIRSGSSIGTYCWEKYRVLDDGTKEFVGFVTSDKESTYPDDDVSGNFYYQRNHSTGTGSTDDYVGEVTSADVDRIIDKIYTTP